MHSVKKNPTTAEQKQLLKKERSIKLRNFSQLRDRIFAKRAQKELNMEMLSLCEAVLAKNPDIYTLWNIRRETLEKLRDQRLSGDETIPDQDRLLCDELGLTEQCIKTNPKSYSAWFQRSWVLGRQTRPDLQKELTMCKSALELDCRNFHCWDHRRVVAAMASLHDRDELAFSSQLIADNFSNFSAWHLRMSLIPRFRNSMNEEKLMKCDDVKEEIKRVANAIFTDPEDQSAWMYARYLVDLYSPSSFLNNESSCPIVPLSASITSNRLLVVFTRSTNLENVVTFFKGICPNANWRAVSLFSAIVCRVWECTLEKEGNIEISRDGKVFEPLTRFYRKDLYERIFHGGPVEVIEDIKKCCMDLLSEEKNNSLALLTVTQCLRLTSPIQSHSIIMENLKKLATSIDPLRAKMYMSLYSYELFRYSLLNVSVKNEASILNQLLEGEGTLSLKYLQLTQLPNMDILSPFITSLDLRGNELQNIEEISLLPLLTHLNADENPIKSLPSSISSLSQLEFISSASTLLSDPYTVGRAIQKCTSLKRFMYCQTPLVEKTDELHLIVGNDIRLIPYYL